MTFPVLAVLRAGVIGQAIFAQPLGQGFRRQSKSLRQRDRGGQTVLCHEGSIRHSLRPRGAAEARCLPRHERRQTIADPRLYPRRVLAGIEQGICRISRARLRRRGQRFCRGELYPGAGSDAGGNRGRDRQAYDWVARNAAQFGGDPNASRCPGHSAGAYLAAQPDCRLSRRRAGRGTRRPRRVAADQRRLRSGAHPGVLRQRALGLECR